MENVKAQDLKVGDLIKVVVEGQTVRGPITNITRSAVADFRVSVAVNLAGEASAALRHLLKGDTVEAERAADEWDVTTHADGWGNWHAKAPNESAAFTAIWHELEDRGEASADYALVLEPCHVHPSCWREAVA